MSGQPWGYPYPKNTPSESDHTEAALAQIKARLASPEPLMILKREHVRDLLAEREVLLAVAQAAQEVADSPLTRPVIAKHLRAALARLEART